MERGGDRGGACGSTLVPPRTVESTIDILS
jgi:hypothetical protein